MVVEEGVKKKSSIDSSKHEPPLLRFSERSCRRFSLSPIGSKKKATIKKTKKRPSYYSIHAPPGYKPEPINIKTSNKLLPPQKLNTSKGEGESKSGRFGGGGSGSGLNIFIEGEKGEGEVGKAQSIISSSSHHHHQGGSPTIVTRSPVIFPNVSTITPTTANRRILSSSSPTQTTTHFDLLSDNQEQLPPPPSSSSIINVTSSSSASSSKFTTTSSTEIVQPEKEFRYSSRVLRAMNFLQDRKKNEDVVLEEENSGGGGCGGGGKGTVIINRAGEKSSSSDNKFTSENLIDFEDDEDGNDNEGGVTTSPLSPLMMDERIFEASKVKTRQELTEELRNALTMLDEAVGEIISLEAEVETIKTKSEYRFELVEKELREREEMIELLRKENAELKNKRVDESEGLIEKDVVVEGKDSSSDSEEFVYEESKKDETFIVHEKQEENVKLEQVQKPQQQEEEKKENADVANEKMKQQQSLIRFRRREDLLKLSKSPLVKQCEGIYRQSGLPKEIDVRHVQTQVSVFLSWNCP